MKLPIPPSNFHGAPSLHPTPQPQRARVVEVVRAGATQAPPPYVVIGQHTRRVRLSKAFIRMIPCRLNAGDCKPGDKLDIGHTTGRRGGHWYIDTHPRVGRPITQDADGKLYLTLAQHFGRELFARPTVGRGIAEVAPTIKLQLGPQYKPTDNSPDGIYLLLPV